MHPTLPQRIRLALVLLPLLGAPLAQAAGPLNLDANGVAIHGHDPVAYFTQSKPVKGSPALAADVGGATYWFASEAHLQAFRAEPARYLPQYGGYCAFGVAHGVKPDIDPNAFTVVDGKLYLNLDPGVRARWIKDIPGYVKAADANWKTLSTR